MLKRKPRQRPPRSSVLFGTVPLLLSLTALLVMLPVLLHPHWGMFDDALVILQNSRMFWQSPTDHLSIFQWRPGLFALAVMLWKLSPNNPFGYYLFNCAVYALTAITTYGCCFLLSRNRLISSLCTLFLFVSPSTFEVIYTLDKQEEYLPLLFSGCLYLFLSNVLPSVKPFSWRLAAMPVASVFLMATFAMLSKETSFILPIIFGLFLFALWLYRVISAPGKSPLVNQRSKWCLAMLLATSAAAIVQKIYTTIVVPPFSYVEIDLNPSQLGKQFVANISAMPEMFGLGLFLFSAGIILIGVRSKSRTREEVVDSCVREPLALGLMLATIGGGVALSAFSTFRIPLAYIWFPMLPVWLPSAAYIIAKVSRFAELKFKWAPHVVYALLVLGILLLIPSRLVDAQVQFQMDAVAHDLVGQLKDRVAQSQRKPKIGLSFFDVGSAEIPERLKFLTYDALKPGYFSTTDESTDTVPAIFFNCLHYTKTDEKAIDLPYGSVGLNSFHGRTLTCSSVMNENHKGWNGYSLFNGFTRVNDYWRQLPLEVGDWYVVPFGEVPRRVFFRGAGLFKEPAMLKANLLSGVSLRSEFEVEREIHTLSGSKRHIGWKAYRITAIEQNH